MSEPRLTFKEMCARFDVTPRTLRYYEYIELLAPEKEGRARYYGPREIARMTLVLRGRRFGFSLEEIRQWLLIYQQKGASHSWKPGLPWPTGSWRRWPSSAPNWMWRSAICAPCAKRHRRGWRAESAPPRSSGLPQTARFSPLPRVRKLR